MILLESKEAVCECGAEEKNRENDGCDVELLFDAAASAVESAVATKGQSDVGTTGLQENSGSEQYCENDLDDVENHSVPIVANPQSPVKVAWYTLR